MNPMKLLEDKLVCEVRDALFKQVGVECTGSKILVAVSGGADSVFLAHVLLLISTDSRRFKVAIAHIDHGIRRESGDDARWVASMAESLGVEFHTGIIPRGTIGQTGLEGAARDLRYGLLGQIATESGADFIATGHNASDQAETLLMRLMRGASLQGLCGIRPVQTGIAPVPVLRPILGIIRQDIEGWLGERGIDYLEDVTNGDERITRNRIRHKLMPMLRESFNPSIEKTIARVAANLADENDVIEGLLALNRGVEVREQAEKREPEDDLVALVELDVDELQNLPQAGVVRAIKVRLKSAGFDPPMGRVHWHRLCELVSRKNGSHAWFPLPGGLVAIKEYSSLRIGPAELLAGSSGNGGDCPQSDWEALPPGRIGSSSKGRRVGQLIAPQALDQITLQVEDFAGMPTRIVQWGGKFLHMEIKSVGQVDRCSLDEDQIVAFSLSNLVFPICIRSWSHGDVMHPFGGPGTSKVKKIFIDRKVPFSLRPLVPVVEDQGGILWLGGIRRSQRAPLGSSGESDELALVISLLEHTGHRDYGGNSFSCA